MNTNPEEDVMFGRLGLRWREVAEQGPKRSATEVLEFLHPELCATLASLHGTPRSVAEATVQLPGFTRSTYWGFVKCSSDDLASLMLHVLTQTDPTDRSYIVRAMR